MNYNRESDKCQYGKWSKCQHQFFDDEALKVNPSINIENHCEIKEDSVKKRHESTNKWSNFI